MLLAATIDSDLAGGSALWLAAGVLLAGLAVLGWRRMTIRGTTLVAPWAWSLVTLLALAGTEMTIAVAGSPAPLWAAELRFAAAMSTFCPTIALLGAKRPQNRAWQAIVASLWAILSLPSLEWLLYGGASEIHSARFWFIVVLIGTGALNGLGTRWWLSSLLYGAGQVALVWPFLFAEGMLTGALGPLVGTLALVLAWLLVAAEWPRPRRLVSPPDRVWLDFRDAFGVVWALRIAERMNASAAMYDWPVVLTWRGFRPRGSHGQIEVPRAVEISLRTLLRRFVSPAWIEARLGPSTGPDDFTRPSQPAGELTT
jgi:hypothetical protein